jgi:hypothetical protein
MPHYIRGTGERQKVKARPRIALKLHAAGVMMGQALPLG